MFRDRETRRKLAVLAMFLGVVFIIGVIWSVLGGEAEWWTLILILPAVAIMKRVAAQLSGPAKTVTPRPGPNAQPTEDDREQHPNRD